MLKNQKEIEEKLGLEEGQLSEFINSEEEKEIDLEKVVIEPKDKYEEKIGNIKKQSAEMAKEVTIKKIKKEFSLEFEGKTEENLIEAFKARDEKIKDEVIKDPEQRYTDLKKDFGLLQDKLKTTETEFSTFKTSVDTDKTVNEIKNSFMNSIEGKTTVGKSTIFVEAKEKGYSFEKVEGEIVVKDPKGEIVKNDALSPLPLKDWVSEFSKPYLVKEAGGGSGEGDDNGEGNAKAGTLEAFEKEAAKAGWDATKKNTEMQARIKAGTLKV